MELDRDDSWTALWIYKMPLCTLVCLYTLIGLILHFYFYLILRKCGEWKQLICKEHWNWSQKILILFCESHLLIIWMCPLLSLSFMLNLVLYPLPSIDEMRMYIKPLCKLFSIMTILVKDMSRENTNEQTHLWGKTSSIFKFSVPPILMTKQQY